MDQHQPGERLQKGQHRNQVMTLAPDEKRHQRTGQKFEQHKKRANIREPNRNEPLQDGHSPKERY